MHSEQLSGQGGNMPITSLVRSELVVDRFESMKMPPMTEVMVAFAAAITLDSMSDLV